MCSLSESSLAPKTPDGVEMLRQARELMSVIETYMVFLNGREGIPPRVLTHEQQVSLASHDLLIGRLGG